MIPELKLKLAERRRVAEPDAFPSSVVFQKVEGVETECRSQVVIRETYGVDGETTWTTLPRPSVAPSGGNIVETVRAPRVNASAVTLTSSCDVEPRRDRRRRNDLEKQLADALSERNGAIARNKRLHADTKRLEEENKALREEVSMLRALTDRCQNCCRASSVVPNTAPVGGFGVNRVSAAVQTQQTIGEHGQFVSGFTGAQPSMYDVRPAKLSTASGTCLVRSVYVPPSACDVRLQDAIAPRTSMSEYVSARPSSTSSPSVSRPSMHEAQTLRLSTPAQLQDAIAPRTSILERVSARPSACGDQSFAYKVSMPMSSPSVSGPSMHEAQTLRLSTPAQLQDAIAPRTSMPEHVSARPSTFGDQSFAYKVSMPTSSPSVSRASMHEAQTLRLSTPGQVSLTGGTFSRPSACSSNIIRLTQASMPNISSASCEETPKRDATISAFRGMPTTQVVNDSVRRPWFSCTLQASESRESVTVDPKPSRASSFVSAISRQTFFTNSHEYAKPMADQGVGCEEHRATHTEHNAEDSATLVRTHCTPQEMESLAQNLRAEQEFWSQVSSEQS